MVVRRSAAGTVTYADAERIVINDTEEYVLRKFEGLNERTCLNQSPSWSRAEGQEGEIIADGPPPGRASSPWARTRWSRS
jgi:DNA-directed RNA polymerase subunit beta